MNFKEIPLSSFDMNPFDLIGKEGMLITAGNESSFNTMTAAWGQMGFLWRQPVATIYVRPQRYTKEFLDATDDFTLSFFGPSGQHALHICGTQSGRDTNKVQDAGITPAPLGDVMTFEEAQLVFVCHKLYVQEINPQDFYEQAVCKDCYPAKDYSLQYIGRIDHVYLREDLYQRMAHMADAAESSCCGHGGGSCGHGDGSGGHGEHSCGHGEGDCGHGERSGGHDHRSCGHGGGACGHEEGSSKHRENSGVHRKGSCSGEGLGRDTGHGAGGCCSHKH